MNILTLGRRIRIIRALGLASLLWLSLGAAAPPEDFLAPGETVSADPGLPPDSMICEDARFEALPAGFTASALGDADQVSTAIVQDQLQLTGTGSVLYHGQDNTAYFWREASGDFRIELDIESLPLQSGMANRKAGFMLRDSSDVVAARVMIEYVPAFPNGPALQFDVRTAQGSVPTELASTQVNVALPVRVAMVRRGNRITILFSKDEGATWTQPLGAKGGSIDVALTDPVQVGANVSSYDWAQPMTAAFDDFRLCKPAPLELPPPVLCNESPLDLVFLVDVSGSMKRLHGSVAGNSRLDSVRDTLLAVAQAIAERGDGSRSALIVSSGNSFAANNLANGARLVKGFDAGPAAVKAAIAQLDDAPIGEQASSPVAIAFKKVLEVLGEQRDPSHRVVLVWSTDNLGNIDAAGRGPRFYTDAELQAISIVDGEDGFFGPEQVLFEGNFNPLIFTYDGQAVADGMHAAGRLLTEQPLRLLGLVPRGDGSLERPLLREDLVSWVTTQSGGQVFGAVDRQGLLDLAAPLLEAMSCVPQGPPPPPGVGIDSPIAGEACLPAGVPFTVSGPFAVAQPSTGEDGSAPPLQLSVQPTSGAPTSYLGTIAADGSRWQVEGILPGEVDGLVQLDAVATNVLGESAHALAALRVDATPPTLTLMEGGAPLPGQGAGATTSAGAVPALFGRPVALTAQVADGALSAPPVATLTLDGAPYAAGTLISAPGVHVLVARVVDCAGREVLRHGVIEIDRTPPALLSTVPAEGAGLQQGPTAYSGSSDPDLASATVGGLAATITGPGNFSFSPYPWREGENTVDIVLVDRAGNRAAYRRTFTVQSLPLTLEIRESGLPITPNQLFLRPVTPRAVAGTSGATVVTTLNGGPFQNGSTISAGGSYTLLATASEGGRTAQAGATFRLDLAPEPTIVITTPLDGARVTGDTVDVAGTVTGDLSGGGVKVNGLDAAISGNTFSLPALPLPDQGILQIEAVVTDRLGRRAGMSVGVLRHEGITLLILDPAPGATTNRESIDVVGVVVGGRQESLDGQAEVGGPAAAATTVSLAPDGSFRAEDVPLAVGSNELYAEVKDRFGNPRRATVLVRADFRPPQIAISANGSPLEEGAVFGRDVELSITLTDDSGQLAATSLRLNGQAQTAVGSPVALTVSEDGGYLLSITARDAAGNEARAERSFVIDRGGCALSDIEPASGGSVDQAVISLRGRSGDATRVEIFVPGNATPFLAQLADGTFLLAGLQLPQIGSNTLQIRCQDASGQGQTLDHVIELLPAGNLPLIEITSPADGALVDVASLPIDGTSSVPRVSVNGASVGVVGNLWSKPAQALVEGPNIVVAQAVDASGRVASDRVVLHRDSQAPKVSISAPDNGARVGIAGAVPASIAVSGVVDLSAEPNLASVVVLSGSQSVTATVDGQGRFLALAVPLDPNASAETAQTLTVRATDSLGHQGTASVEVYLDKTGPAIELSAPNDLERYGQGTTGPIEVRGKAWAIDGARITINGSQLDPATLAWGEPAANGRRETEFTTAINLPDRDGTFGVQARAIDPQDRTAQDRRLLFLDTKAPLTVELIPADGTVGVAPDSLLFALFDENVLKSSLTDADGLKLVRVSTGEVLAGSYTVAGSAVGFASSSSLLRGESYHWQAGLGIRDLAGNALGQTKVTTFTVGDLASAAAPSLDPLPALICADRLAITGQASPGALVKVRDGSLLLATYADPEGAFRLELPISSNGFHLLHVFAVDAASGIGSPEVTSALQVDCSAPQVRDAFFDRVSGVITVTFSEKIAEDTLTLGQAGDAIELEDAEDPDAPPQSAVLQLNENVLTLQLDGGEFAWWRERPVRLSVGPPAADLEGNVMPNRYETVFFPGSSGGLAGGFLFGEAYDDATGRPLAGVSVKLFSSSDLLPGAAEEGAASSPQVAVVTEGRGRYTLAGEVAVGRYALLLERAGYSRVVRRLSLEPAKGSVPFDSRLTPLGEVLGEELDPATGGRRERADLYAFEAAAGVLPGSAPLKLRLTPLSAQGLPDFLPLGHTPAAAVEVRLEATDGGGALAAALAENALFLPGASLELPLPSWVNAGDALIAVQYELATGRWLVLPQPQRTSLPGGGELAIAEPRGPGVVAIVVADIDARVAPPLAVPGEVLLGSEAPDVTPSFTAELSLDPPVVPPTGRSQARVLARAADLATPWPSGLAVQAFLEERLVLAAGLGQELEAPFSVDLLLYHPRLTAQELGGSEEAAAGELRFVVSPSPRAAQVLLDVGWENIRIYPFPEETQRGQVVGPTGGTVGDPQVVELTIPEGALSSATVAGVELLDENELTALDPVAGYTTLAAVRLSFQGRELGRAATLRLKAPAGTPAEVVGDPRLILGQRIEEPGDYRGSLVRLATRALEQGSGEGRRLLFGPESNGSLPLDGVVQEGLYLVLRAIAPIGFASGLVTYEGGAPLELARVVAEGLGTADSARQTGRYNLPVPAGASRLVHAFHPQTDEQGAAQVDLAAGQVIALNLQVRRQPPTIVQLLPAEDAQNVAPNTAIAITFSEPLSASSIGAGTLQLELAGSDGRGSGVFAEGEAHLTATGETLQFLPVRPLLPGRTWIARFSGGVTDLQGTAYAGSARSWSFSTGDVVLPGSIDPTRFHVRIPENGVAAIFADPGALPGTGGWSVSPYVVGPWRGRDPVRNTYPVAANGSFQGTLGRLPDYPVTIESAIWVVVLGPSNQVEAEFEVGPLVSADGKGFVAKPGEALTFRSAEGVVVDVPAEAFDKATMVRIEMLDPSRIGVATPAGMAVGAYVFVDFDGRANETLRVHVPAPASAPVGADVFIGQVKTLPWGKRLQMLSYGGVEQKGSELFLANAPELQAEPDRSTLAGLSSADGALSLRSGDLEALTPGDEEPPPRTCRDIKERGLGRCYAQNLLMEFQLRSLAAFYFELGADFTLMTGGFWDGSFGGLSAIADKIADNWVYLPRPFDSRGNFWILPVIEGTPFTLTQRDLATGWVIAEKAYDPVPAGGFGIQTLDPIDGSEAQSPLLIGAKPFQVLRFGAPPKERKTRLRLEIEAETSQNEVLSLNSVDAFPLPDNTTVSLFDLSPLVPKKKDEGPLPPIEGPEQTLCGDGELTLSMRSGPDFLAVVAPGDLDAEAVRQFEFTLDRRLVKIEEKPADQVAKLRDLGKSNEDCKPSTEGGYPRSLTVRVELDETGRKLTITPLEALPGGHVFELELIEGGIEAANGSGESSGKYYWDSAPKRFRFATRKVLGEPVGTVDPSKFPLGNVATARDLLRLGNLVLVASDSGELVAFDATNVKEEGKLEPFALLNAASSNHRNFALDGHNRVFYTGIFGAMWATKVLRLEDIYEAKSEKCAGIPEWAQGLACFDGVEGAVRFAYMPGSPISTASSYLSTGAAYPSGLPSDLELLVQDEKGKALELKDFVDKYQPGTFGGLMVDDEGFYTFDVPLISSYARGKGGAPEPSKPGVAAPPTELRDQACLPEEPKHDRYQRATVDNLTTGQSWSIDLENEWPDEDGDGHGKVEKVRARRGDQLQVRYNLRTLGYVSISGAGISVLDLNRSYGLPLPRNTAGGSQCGRRLGRYEGAYIQWPACAQVFGQAPEGLTMTPSLAVQTETGCDENGAGCRGTGRIDIYSPMQRVGGIHTKSSLGDPGFLDLVEMAACIGEVDGKFPFLRDTVLANDVTWLDFQIHGNLSRVFNQPDPPVAAKEKKGDLAFLSLGVPGILVFDVSERTLTEGTVIGLLKVDNHTAFRLQVDEDRGQLYAGGTDIATNKPVIDVWDLRYVNGGPGTKIEPKPIASVEAPWSTNHIGIDPSGTGLIYTWDDKKGPLAVPFDRPRFRFSGVYLPKEGTYTEPEEGEQAPSVQQISSRFVPLGVPMEVNLEGEESDRKENERQGTAAFKVRIALPGSLGDVLTAKVQTLRVLPEERVLGQEDIGGAVAFPGGPGWPDHEVTVTLRRLGVGEEEDDQQFADGESGRFGNAYNLYESEETVLLLGDPRAGKEYRRQEAEEESEVADEESQCRRCEWPSYLPDPENTPSQDPELKKIKELLAGGPYVRAILWEDPEGDEAIRQKTHAAIEFFEAQGENYPSPAGYAEVVASAAPVPSPFQASLAEPAQNASMWNLGEAGAAVSLVGGDLLVSEVDHLADGRGIPFTFNRVYRSQSLGYGPLGSAGWNGNLFSRLRENTITGEVEYHDGSGNVWRFYPPDSEPGDDYEKDPAGSYKVAKGVYLRLQKLTTGGWRLIGRQHDTAEFDATGRLQRISDRHRRSKGAEEQGNTLELSYDAFGQLSSLVDDLGRQYRFEYFDDPRSDLDGGDGKKFGLLKKIEDFVERSVEYEYDDDRLLTKVKLPEVKNPVDVYSFDYSFEGEQRPTLQYRYGKMPMVDDSKETTKAVLHGDFAKLRLSEVLIPEFGAGLGETARAVFSYVKDTGRIEEISLPTPENTNGPGAAVVWRLETPGFNQEAGPAKDLELVAPWGHRVTYKIDKGRTKEVEQLLAVVQPDNGTSIEENVKTAFTYTEDGRVATVEFPDGGKRTHCYPDAKDEAGSACAAGSGEPDRLTLANVVNIVHAAGSPEGQGSADYSSLDVSAEYHEDNMVSAVTDGLSRSIQLPVPQANTESRSTFQTEGISSTFEHDAFGRVKQAQRGNTIPYDVTVQFKSDVKEKEEAGLPGRVEMGVGQLWRAMDYDPQFNVESVTTSQGTEARADYDSWDRQVRTISGNSSGRLIPVGSPECGLEAAGARTERAFDAVGHLAKERHLQDYVEVDGSLQCRWVETSYKYNAREQLIEVEQTHLSNPNVPGEVDSSSRAIMRLEYDEFGRLGRHLALNTLDPSVVTTFRYDDAGRIEGVEVGDAAEQVRGYDRKNRVVKTNDGDSALWLGRYDVWDRLYLSKSPTGAFTKNTFDRAGHLIETATSDGDPFGAQSGNVQLLSVTKSHFTSFSEPDKVVQILVDEESGERQILVSIRDFDDAGRVKAVWSGPALANAEEIDSALKRRESEVVYEEGTGRTLEVSHGGYQGQSPSIRQRFYYETDNESPWPDALKYFESVPGQEELIETASASFRRDAFGRVIEERRNDGSLITRAYDRSSNQLLRLRTGAESETKVAYDGVGRQVRMIRPNHRGETLFAYDLDGRLRKQRVTTADESWETSYQYDRTGRLERTNFHDGSFSLATYNPDSTIKTQRTREGVVVTYSYDAANRPLSQVPSLEGPAESHLVSLDAGDFVSYDKLSRPTVMSRGSVGQVGVNTALSVAYPTYDLGSRPSAEVVGARGPLSWQYDVYNRPEKVFLPDGPGRDSMGAFEGFRRQYDTLDRLIDVAGIGSLTVASPGAAWSWGGGRLYGMDTKGTLGTSMRYGYLGGEGPQLPIESSADSRWKLGTLTWGAGSSGLATEEPPTVWGQFGFGWRGTEGDPRDGTKIGRMAIEGAGLDLFAGQGWSWDYDAGVRLSGAWPGRGDLEGRKPLDGVGFLYTYGKGDELEKVIDEAAGTVAATETGAYGRIISRGGEAFSYDLAGRRTEDDRFVYDWNWRSELMQVTVKDAWPGGEVTPFAGQQVRYVYDAIGRLHSRSHYATLPQGVFDDAQRTLVEKRVFVWENHGLLAEAGYGDEAEGQLRWRKTYVPGASGLDDAIQVLVDDVAFPAQGKKLYTYLRDELGTVIGIVAEEESQDPSAPTIPVRYLYTPYGEAYAEVGPDLRRARFDAGIVNVGGIEQAPASAGTAAGGIRLSFSIPVDPATIAAGISLEQLTGSGWQAVGPTELLIGIDELESLEVLVSLRSAWPRGVSYRVSLGQSIEDKAGRALVTSRKLEFTAPPSFTLTTVPFDQRIPVGYESYRAASETLGGRFPGGQTSLFQGLWTDPLTGVAYARARWYDARNATWLSQDPLLDINSPNLYAFVGWTPAMGTDPSGMTCQTKHGGTNDWCDPMSNMELSSETSGWYTAWAVTKDTLGNTVNELLLLDTIADMPHATMDEDLSTGERVWAGVKGTGVIVFDVFGGAIVSKMGTKLLATKPAQYLATKLMGSKLGQEAVVLLSKDVKVLARESLEALDRMAAKFGAEKVEAVVAETSSDLFASIAGRNVSTLTRNEVGAIGEEVGERLLVENGFTDIISIQNASGNGLDVIARNPQGKLTFFEVKASRTGDVKSLSSRQQSMETFVEDILSQASTGTGRYQNIPQATQDLAREMLREFRTDISVTGYNIGVDLFNQVVRISPWAR